VFGTWVSWEKAGSATGTKKQHAKKATGKNKEYTDETEKIWKSKQIPSRQIVFAFDACEGKPRNRGFH
jgi:hypothetical protein